MNESKDFHPNDRVNSVVPKARCKQSVDKAVVRSYRLVDPTSGVDRTRAARQELHSLAGCLLVWVFGTPPEREVSRVSHHSFHRSREPYFAEVICAVKGLKEGVHITGGTLVLQPDKSCLLF